MCVIEAPATTAVPDFKRLQQVVPKKRRRCVAEITMPSTKRTSSFAARAAAVTAEPTTIVIVSEYLCDVLSL